MSADSTLDDYDLQKKSLRLEKYILPSDLEKFKAQGANWINTWASGDFKITRTELPYVTVKFKARRQKMRWQKKPKWGMQLTFKTELFNGQVYIVPSGAADNYITAWWTTKQLGKGL